MVGSSKILTVSYGTFSCTLEGFDDSFSTMKAIAEYFRDLASDDRYFGAEPPTPDADMLARIAEREISRRVEARTGDDGIVLRAASALTGPDTDEASEAAPEKASKVQDDPVAADAPAMPPVATPPVDVAPVEMPEVAENPAPSTGSEEQAQAAPLAASQPVQDTVEEDDASEGMSFDDMAPDAAPADEDIVHPDAESVAAKLQRIRAVVGKGTHADAFVEDQHATSAPAMDMDINDSFEADVADADEMDVAEETSEIADEVMEDVKTTSEDAIEDAAEDYDDEVEETSLEIETAEEEDAAEDNTSDQDDVLANVAAGLASEDAAPAAKTPVRARIVRLRKDVVVGAADADADSADAAEDAPAVDEDLIANVLGADDDTAAAPLVLKDEVASELDAAEETNAGDMSFDDDDEDVAEDAADDAEDFADMAEELADDAEDHISIAALDGADELLGSDHSDEDVSDLSDADEADLQEELAEVEREVADMPAVQQRQGRNILPETDDAAMSRIMSQTDEALEEPEGNRRRNAIAQLKAAVAATEAARQLGDSGSKKEEAENAFREDLNDAVRPARPTRPVAAEGGRTERPRPAPLKLVASQRVDAPASSTADAAPVTPRRVAMTESAVQTDAASFAEFAEEMGATELPDLLEAAAAYTAFVEGVEDFSRPQIMKKVQLTTDEAFSREDGLRSFGTLLRQGRISKVRNGRFQVSEQTRFRPEQRAG